MVIALCLAPFRVLYRGARIDAAIVFFEVLISPFRPVRFKHFLLADILTSIVYPLKDLGAVSCFYLRGLWLKSEVPSEDTCPGLRGYQYSVMFIPFWFRFAQSLRRYHDNRAQVFNLVNAAKYVSIMAMASLYVAFDMNRDSTALRATYITFGLLVTAYCLAWDFYIDWGLFRTRAPGK